ncbi:MAG: RidA family protein [Desulfitobacterium hafniense]|nr:RidA family protein [Desulfitobacterium hafniense]
MHPEQILKEKYGLELPNPTIPSGFYTPVSQTGNLLYVSGHTPKLDGRLKFKGKVGTDLSIEEGQEAARLAAINCLAAIKAYIGDLRKVKKIVHVVGYVRSADGFGDQPKVLNGASSLFNDLFGESGSHSRAALGSNELPGGAAVEVMCIVEIC